MADELDQGRYAYVTLLSTTDYLDAVLVLNKSLQKVNSKYPLLAMVVDTIFTPEMEACFQKHGIRYHTVKPLQYSEETQEKYQDPDSKSVLNTASKLQLFTLKNWDKLVYIDADTLVLQNIDDLFTYPDGSMIQYPDDIFGFSGLFVFYPRHHQEDEFYPTIMKYHMCVDGDLLGKIWFFVRESPAHQIPANYLVHYNHVQMPANTKVVHYCNHYKPWIHTDYEYFNQDNYICWLYKKYLTEIRESFN